MWLDSRIAELKQTFSTILWCDAFLTAVFSPMSFLLCLFGYWEEHIHIFIQTPLSVACVASVCSLTINNCSGISDFFLPLSDKFNLHIEYSKTESVGNTLKWIMKCLQRHQKTPKRKGTELTNWIWKDFSTLSAVLCLYD